MQLKDAQLFRQQAYINGEWLDADNGQTIKVTNPATGEVIGTVGVLGPTRMNYPQALTTVEVVSAQLGRHIAEGTL